MSSLKSLKHWLRRVLTVWKFYFFWGQIISFYDCSETLISHLILDIWSSEKLHLDRSLVFCEFQKQIKSLKLLNLILKTVCPRVSLGKISGICQMGRWPPILDPHRQPLLIGGVLIRFFFFASWGNVMNFTSSKKNYVIQFLINCLQEKGKNSTSLRRKWTDNLFVL